MKKTLKLLGVVVCAMSLALSCSDDHVSSSPEKDRAYFLSLIGTIEHRMATAEELANLPHPNNLGRIAASCTLGDDVSCDDADEDVEYFIANCTNYTHSWPPTGAVTTFYKGFSYYVDSDSDINLDQYEDDLQAQVDDITATTGAVAYIEGTTLDWPCGGGYGTKVGVIQYTVYE